MTNDKSGLQASFGLINFLDPLLSPQVLIREESVADLVVLLDGAFVVLLLGEFGRELFHGDGDAVEEVAWPGDWARNSGQVADDWGCTLVLGVGFLDLHNLVLVVLEQGLVLVVQVVAEVVTVKDSLELSEQLKRVFDVSNNKEVLVNVLLKRSLNRWHINIKLNEVTIERVVVEVKKLMVLLLEGSYIALEGVHDGLNVLQVVLLKSLELLDSWEEFLQFGDTAAE